MKIIIQDHGHATARLVSSYTPVANAFYPEDSEVDFENRDIVWDRISYRFNKYGGPRLWKSQPKLERPEVFNFNPAIQVMKVDANPAEVIEIWNELRAHADSISGKILRDVEEDTLDAFNCRSALMYCFDRAGIRCTEDDFFSRLGTQYDFSQIGLDF